MPSACARGSGVPRRVLRPGQAEALDEVGTDLSPVLAASEKLSARASGCGPPSRTGVGAVLVASTRGDHREPPRRWSCCRPARSFTTMSWMAPTPGAGSPAVHRRFAGLHRSLGWNGSPEASALPGRSCSGTFACPGRTRCSPAGLTADRLARGRRVRPDAHRADGGQYLDMFEQARASSDGRSVAAPLIRFKSAKYTVERRCSWGLAGRRHRRPRRPTAAYGMPLGEAFQLRDDVLGVFGDPTETGKPAGDDLREGKRTVLVAAVLERCAPSRQRNRTTAARRPAARRGRGWASCAR